MYGSFTTVEWVRWLRKIVCMQAMRRLSKWKFFHNHFSFPLLLRSGYDDSSHLHQTSLMWWCLTLCRKKIRVKKKIPAATDTINSDSMFKLLPFTHDDWLLVIKSKLQPAKMSFTDNSKKKHFHKRKRSRCQPTNSENNSKSISTTWNVYVEGSAAVQRRRRPTRRSFCSCRSSKKEIIIKQSRAENARKWKLMWRRRRACVCMNV